MQIFSLCTLWPADGIQEVSGSIPLISTTKSWNRKISGLFLFIFRFFLSKRVEKPPTFPVSLRKFSWPELECYLSDILSHSAKCLTVFLRSLLTNLLLNMQIMRRHTGICTSNRALNGLHIDTQRLHPYFSTIPSGFDRTFALISLLSKNSIIDVNCHSNTICITELLDFIKHTRWVCT